jgi:hypothetical protein
VAGETAILMADSYASESMIDNSIDVSGLEKMTDDYLLLKGFGGSAGERVGEMYKVPIEMRLGAEPQYVLARQTDLVEKLGGKCLIARLDQKRLGMTLMQERDEILVKVTDESGKVAHEVFFPSVACYEAKRKGEAVAAEAEAGQPGEDAEDEGDMTTCRLCEKENCVSPLMTHNDDRSSTDDCGDPDNPEWDGVPGGLAFENCTMELDRVDLDPADWEKNQSGCENTTFLSWLGK